VGELDERHLGGEDVVRQTLVPYGPAEDDEAIEVLSDLDHEEEKRAIGRDPIGHGVAVDPVDGI
jgi:hypothetical protein